MASDEFAYGGVGLMSGPMHTHVCERVGAWVFVHPQETGWCACGAAGGGVCCGCCARVLQAVGLRMETVCEDPATLPPALAPVFSPEMWAGIAREYNNRSARGSLGLMLWAFFVLALGVAICLALQSSLAAGLPIALFFAGIRVIKSSVRKGIMDALNETYFRGTLEAMSTAPVHRWCPQAAMGFRAVAFVKEFPEATDGSGFMDGEAEFWTLSPFELSASNTLIVGGAGSGGRGPRASAEDVELALQNNSAMAGTGGGDGVNNRAPILLSPASPFASEQSQAFREPLLAYANV